MTIRTQAAQPQAAACLSDQPVRIAIGAARLLDSVAAITHIRDIDALDHSLVLSLAELTDAGHVELRRYAQHNPDQPASIVRCHPHDGAWRVTIESPPGAGGVDSVPVPATTAATSVGRMSIPVVHDSRTLATLLIDNPADPDDALTLVNGFARIYANYIALLNESERDKLTGLFNRRTFERHLQRQLGVGPAATAAARPRPPSRDRIVWVAIVDIDHFKRVNDTFGHLYGDEVILLMAQRMHESFGEQADLFRFGGEEFVILFQAPDEVSAADLLDGFRARVADRPFPQVGAVSVSIGFCRIGLHDFPEVALDRADQALYYAKSHGRNQVHGHQRLIREGMLKPVSSGSIDLF